MAPGHERPPCAASRSSAGRLPARSFLPKFQRCATYSQLPGKRRSVATFHPVPSGRILCRDAELLHGSTFTGNRETDFDDEVLLCCAPSSADVHLVAVCWGGWASPSSGRDQR